MKSNLHDQALDDMGLTHAESRPLRAAPKPAKRQRPELALQVSVKKWLTLAIASPGDLSRQNVVWYAVDHAARVSPWQGAARKSQGVIRGIPDLDIYYNEAAFKIEFKVPGGVLSLEQKALHAALRATGVNVAVCWSLDEVIAQIKAWRIPTRVAG